MQAVELMLLEPIVDAAILEAEKMQPEYRIVAWLHDGFVVKARRRPDALQRKLSHLVARQTDRLGVPTALEARVLRED